MATTTTYTSQDLPGSLAPSQTGALVDSTSYDAVSQLTSLRYPPGYQEVNNSVLRLQAYYADSMALGIAPWPMTAGCAAASWPRRGRPCPSPTCRPTPTWCSTTATTGTTSSPGCK